NTDPNNVALISINEELGFPVFHVGFWAGGEEDLASVTETQPNGTYHACEGETSLMMACNEDLVAPCYKQLSGPLVRKGEPELAQIPSTFRRMEWSTPNGIRGNSYAATKEKGEHMIAFSVGHLSDILCCDELWAGCAKK
ncbi:MAG: creatininase family protein, partial [Clostridia bacterium]